MKPQNNKKNSLAKKTVKDLRPKTLNTIAKRPSKSFDRGGDSYEESNFGRYKNSRTSSTESKHGNKSGYRYSKRNSNNSGSYREFGVLDKNKSRKYNSSPKNRAIGGSGEAYKTKSQPTYETTQKPNYKNEINNNQSYTNEIDYPERKSAGYLGEYQLLDCGDSKKLEAFGSLLLIRPCPQALWPKSGLNKIAEVGNLGQKSISELWNLADFEFVRAGQEKGFWWHRKTENLEARKTDFENNRYPFSDNLPSFWTVSHAGITWRIEPNQFGNIGIFSEHFEYAPKLLQFFDKTEKVLNLFTYSGSNCVLLAKNGFKITAVDSSKSAISAFNENLQNNNVSKDGCRLILEDAYKFVAREVRREVKYGSIMIDAPSYGRGTKGEVFNIEESLKELILSSKELMSPNSKMIITLHSPRFTPKMLEIFIKSLFADKKVSVEEIVQNCLSGNQLTSGMLVYIE